MTVVVRALTLIITVSLCACAPTLALAKAPPAAVRMNARLSNPAVGPSRSQTAYLKVGLQGLRGASAQRTPVNLAIVLDKSSSMQGSKMREARAAAIMAVKRLDAEDVVSVVTYDSVVEVVVAATPVTDPEAVVAAIERIQPGGMTALFGGVAKGAAEARRFFDPNRVNRIIVLSDGIANVGPSSAGELAELGSSLGREGFSVTTLGLGLDYNEDLMSRLALASDGNHAFVEHAEQLAKIFELEFGDVFSVVAQDVDVLIECAPGIKPLRMLGRDADIVGRRVEARLNQLYADQEKFVMLEVQLPATPAGVTRPVASVSVDYADPHRRVRGAATTEVAMRTVRSASVAERHVDGDVMVDALVLIASERSRAAIALRDDGKVEEAKEALDQNLRELRKEQRRFKSPKLRVIEERTERSKDAVEERDWRKGRKQMVKDHLEDSLQQAW